MATFLKTSASTIARVSCLAVLALAIAGASISAADNTPRFTYQCRLSTADHVRRSDGVQLASIPGIQALDILLQDRLNFHRFGLRDPEDTNDGYYTPATRSAFISLFEKSRLVVSSPSLEHEILRGNPWIEVAVGDGEIRVHRLEAPAPPASATANPASTQLQTQAQTQTQTQTERPTGNQGKAWANWNRVAGSLAILLITMLVADPVRRFVLEGREHQEPVFGSRFFRAGVFFAVSIFLLWRSQAILNFIECHSYPWFLPMLMAVTSATFVALKPRTTLFTLVCWPIVLLMIATALPVVLTGLLFLMIAAAVLVTPYALYAWTMWYPMVWLYERFGTMHASVYCITWLTFFILTIRGIRRLSLRGAADVWDAGSKVSKFIHQHSPAWLVARLLARCAECAAVWLGDNWRESGDPEEAPATS